MRNNIFIASILLLLLLISSPAYGGDTIDEQRESLVLLARQGHLVSAISDMTELFNKYPQDLKIRADLITLLIWNDNVPEVLTLFEEYPEYAYPEYVRSLMIGVYRKEGKTESALSLVNELLILNPTHHKYQLKKAQLLIDAGEFADARDILAILRPQMASEPDYHKIALYLATSEDKWIEALDSGLQLVSFEDEKRNAIKKQIKALRHLAAPFGASKIEIINPDIIDPAESAAILMTKAALYLRWGKTTAENEEEKFIFALKALSFQFQALAVLGNDSIYHENIRKIKEDMVVSLNDAGMAVEALYLYGQLVKMEPVPPYVSQSAGTAALSLQDPEEAVHLLEQVTQAEPDNHHTKVILFYAYIEAEYFQQAAELAKTMMHEVPAMRVFTDSAVQYANPTYLDGVVLSILAKLYSDQLAEARIEIDDVKEKAPANDWFRQISGEVALARAHPRLALDEFSAASLLNSENNDARAGQASALLQINEYEKAEKIISQLSELYPFSSSTRRLTDELYWSQRPDLWGDMLYTYSEGPEQEGDGIVATGEIISMPLYSNLRLNGLFRYSWSEIPEGEEDLLSYGVGLEYANRLGGIFAMINNNESTVDEPGGRGRVLWTPDDHWSIILNGAIFSEATPLRALYYGISMDKLDGSVSYRWNETRQVSVSLGSSRFSDDNERLEGGARFSQRLMDIPRFDLDGSIDLYGSQNSRRDAPYYNPESDFSGRLTLKAEHVLYRFYENSIIHALAAGWGVYDQKNYDADWVGSVKYEPRCSFSPRIEGRAGFEIGRNVYDGQPEPFFSLNFLLHVKL